MKKDTTPQIAAIHDLSGYGRASLTVVIPILSAMGIQVCPLPTAILSTHTEYKNFHYIDLTNHMQPIIDHWKELNLKFDAIYSGYLGSAEQIHIVKQFIQDFKKEKQLIIVDPVMGDNGQLYTGTTEELVKEMKSLIKDADIITPNLTEAAYLSGMNINESSSLEEIKKCAKTLALEGPNTIIITSAPSQDKDQTAVLYYEKDNDRFNIISNEYIHASYPGTGDAFTSVLTGSLLNGDKIEPAISNATKFIVDGIKETIKKEHDPLNGINQEAVLPSLKELYN